MFVLLKQTSLLKGRKAREDAIWPMCSSGGQHYGSKKIWRSDNQMSLMRL
jgi:hypothetical protein